MPDARDDFQSVVVPDPGSSTGKYVVFIGSSDTGFINYVNLDKLTSPLRGVVTGSPSGAFTSASRTAAMAAFYHDNHIFLVGGINTGTPKPGNGVASLAAVKVTKPADGATGLSFQWVDNFVPSSGQGPIDVSPKVVPPPIEQPTTGSSLSAGAWIAISLSLALVAALGAVVAVRRLKASKSGEYGSVYTNGGTVGIDGPMVPRSGPRVSESANGVRSQAGDSDQVDGATAAAAIDAYLMRQRLENLGQYHSPPPPQQMMGQDLGYGVPPTSQGGMYPPPPPPQPPNGGGAYPTPPAPPSTSTAAYSQLSPEQQLLLQQQIQIQQLQLQQLQQLQQQRVSMNGLIPPHLLAALVPNGSGLPVSGGGSMPPLYAAPGSMQYAGSLPQPPMTPMSSGHGGGGDSSGGGYVMAMPMPLGGGGANGGQHWLAPPQQQQQQLLHPHHPLLKMPSMASLQALAPGGIVPGTGPEDDSGILEGLPEVPAAPAAAQPAAAVPATTTGAHESISTPPMPGRDFLTNPFSVDERSLLLGPGPTAARWEAAVASDRIEQDQRHHMQIQQQIQQQIQRHSAAIQAQLQQQQGQGQQ
ncbi:hypothetical protein BC828DRAFT_219578 [Blastocladiella britannica]|nr:hypothetical protein BC828DRAFT_219578 [Blastocladiella britannica]